MQAFLRTLSPFAPKVLRWGLATVILWFGVQQLLEPSAWVAWVPAWATGFGFPATTIVYVNGTFEVVLGLLLLVGVWTRLAAFALFLHLCVIVFEIGMNPTGVRDFGLAIALLAIALREE